MGSLVTSETQVDWRIAFGIFKYKMLEQSDGQMHTYPGMLVPHYVADANNNSRSITLTSRPLYLPMHISFLKIKILVKKIKARNIKNVSSYSHI